MDVAWERSALKHVAAAHTPTPLMHGENDNDVPIAEAEQFFIALKDVGRRRFSCATRAKGMASGRRSTSSIGPTGPSPGTRNTFQNRVRRA
jgi:hypothetical protein